MANVGMYFRLDENQMNTILSQVLEVVAQWKEIATKIGISNKEIQLMQKAFKM